MSVRQHSTTRTAFSLIELVIVVVIIGTIAAIAVPRFSNAAASSANSALAGSLTTLNKAAELYMIEHGGRTPAQDADGTVNTDPAALVARLTKQSDDAGTGSGPSIYGPYLRSVPTNPVNGLRTIRIGVSGVNKNIDGWIFSPQSNSFMSDAGNTAAGAVPEAPGPEAL